MKSAQLLHSGSVIGTTPFNEEEEYMSLDRSPSPRHGGGWSSPGLTATPPNESSTTNGRLRGPSPSKKYGELGGGGSEHVTWEGAKANSARVNGYPRYQSQNQGFFARHMRRISSGLPYFTHGGQEDRYAEKEKLGRGRIPGRLDWRSVKDVNFWKELPRRIGLLLSRRRKYVTLILLVVMSIFLFSNESKNQPFVTSPLSILALTNGMFQLRGTGTDVMARLVAVASSL